MESQTSPNTKPDQENFIFNKPKEVLMLFFDEEDMYNNNDSTCSTPFVSAPSSPGRTTPDCGGGGSINGGFYYSCPASPMHFAIKTTSFTQQTPSLLDNDGYGVNGLSSNEFEFSSRSGLVGSEQIGLNTMSSADELFLDGKIRPMKLSTHLERPQVLSPLLDLEEDQENQETKHLFNDNSNDVKGNGDEKQSSAGSRGRDLIRSIKEKSLRGGRRRRTRSMSPMRTISFDFSNDNESSFLLQVNNDNIKEHEISSTNNGDFTSTNATSDTTSAAAATSSSRSSSSGRNPKKWDFLKEFLYRSKSEGRTSTINKFWSNISLSPANKDKNNKNEGLGSVSKDPKNKDKIKNEGVGFVTKDPTGKDKNKNGGKDKIKNEDPTRKDKNKSEAVDPVPKEPKSKDKNKNEIPGLVPKDPKGKERNESLGSVSKDPKSKDKKNEGVGSVSKDKNEASSSNSNSNGSDSTSSTNNNKKPVNGVSNRRRVSMRSVHEMHYKERRAQAEEMRRRTYLPYRQGLIGCLGFSSKSYGAMNGFARALNPVSSR